MEITNYHRSVLTNEVIHFLKLVRNGRYVDCTFGGGGHTKAILEAEPTATVIAFDWDTTALEVNGKPLQEKFQGRLTLVWGSFIVLEKKLKKMGIECVDGILADFGTSLYQLKHRPGFSFAGDTPLDMRMSPAYQKVTAADVLNTEREAVLVKILREFGEEPHARRIARAIVSQRQRSPFKTTKQLVDLLYSLGVKGKRHLHPATRVFQGLRIFVNKELENIQLFLPQAFTSLCPGARLVCISFHSLEDRIVKHFFKEKVIKKPSTGLLVTPKVVTATEKERKTNPSARSAKLRVLERI